MSALRLYTTQEAAEILQVTRSTVCMLIRQGKLPAVKAGRSWKIAAPNLAKFLKVDPEALKEADLEDKKHAATR